MCLGPGLLRLSPPCPALTVDRATARCRGITGRGFSPHPSPPPLPPGPLPGRPRHDITSCILSSVPRKTTTGTSPSSVRAASSPTAPQALPRPPHGSLRGRRSLPALRLHSAAGRRAPAGPPRPLRGHGADVDLVAGALSRSCSSESSGYSSKLALRRSL